MPRLEAILLPRLESVLASRFQENLLPPLAERLETLVNSRMSGARKDMTALAHRLTGLEKEGALNKRLLAEFHDASSSGTRFLVRHHDLIGRLVADGQEWEPHVRQAIEKAARASGVAVDVGAYIGLHTVTMARLFARVHAFEPQPAIYQTLCGNLVLNGCANATAHNVALYDSAGEMHLAPAERQEIAVPMAGFDPDYSLISNAAALTYEVRPSGSGNVKSMALDDLSLEDVALMKVDTQGSDLHVLRGAVSTIRRCRPVVLFEWERDLDQQHNTRLEDFFSFFSALDYNVTMLHETTPGRQADYIAEPARAS